MGRPWNGGRYDFDRPQRSLQLIRLCGEVYIATMRFPGPFDTDVEPSYRNPSSYSSGYDDFTIDTSMYGGTSAWPCLIIGEQMCDQRVLVNVEVDLQASPANKNHLRD